MADDQVQDIANQQERLERARAFHLHDLAVEIAAETAAGEAAMVKEPA